MGFVLLLAGCASPFGESDDGDFVPLAAETMFDSGLSHVQDIYIDQPHVARLALIGLNGLRRIEPSLAVVWAGKEVRLIIAGDIAARAKITDDGDTALWASVMTKLIVKGRQRSTTLGGATAEDIYEAVFDTVVEQLDPYSRYSSAETARKERARRNGFGGIGVTIAPHADGARIVMINPEQPAAKAGLIAGDIIIAVDGDAVAGFPKRRINKLLRGEIGKEVVLTVRRAATIDPFTVSLERRRIVQQTVYSRQDGDFTQLRITRFNQHTAGQMLRMVKKIRRKKGVTLRGIILDIRGNPGGVLGQAVALSDLFLQAGKILSTRGRHPKSLQLFDAHIGDIAHGLPIAVLMDGASASAAEILASALQDRGRAVLIGASSFGKGTVQNVVRLPNGGELILTWARMHAPSGYILHRLGVLPTICTSHAVSVDTALGELVREGADVIRRNMRARRLANHKDARDRKAIKALCPWRPREDSDLDLELAERILVQPDLYRKLLASARPEAGI